VKIDFYVLDSKLTILVVSSKLNTVDDKSVVTARQPIQYKEWPRTWWVIGHTEVLHGWDIFYVNWVTEYGFEGRDI